MYFLYFEEKFTYKGIYPSVEFPIQTFEVDKQKDLFAKQLLTF